MSNPAEEALLSDPEYQEKIVIAVCEGVEKYLKSAKAEE